MPRFNMLNAEYLDQAVADGRRMVQKISMTISVFPKFFRPNKEIIVFSALKQIKADIALVESSFQNSHISIHINAPHDLNLLGFPNEYSQVLLNLLSNAKEAILAHNKMHRHPGGVDIVLSEQNRQGCVTVRDNGGDIGQNLRSLFFYKGIGDQRWPVYVENDHRTQHEGRHHCPEHRRRRGVHCRIPACSENRSQEF